MTPKKWKIISFLNKADASAREMTILIPVVQERLSQESWERTQTSQINMQTAFCDYDKGVLIFKGSGAWSKLLLFLKLQRWTSEC